LLASTHEDAVVVSVAVFVGLPVPETPNCASIGEKAEPAEKFTPVIPRVRVSVDNELLFTVAVIVYRLLYPALPEESVAFDVSDSVKSPTVLLTIEMLEAGPTFPVVGPLVSVAV
jgi:hypothetical protein